METNLTKGSPARLLLAFAWPVFFGNLFQIFYNLVDMAIVGRFVGVTALASVGAAGSPMFCLTGLVTGLTSGFGIWIARFYGANEECSMKHYTAVSLWLCLVSSMLITLVGVWGIRPLLVAMKTPEDIFSGSYTYLLIIVIGIAVTMAYNMLACILRALGDSKTPLYFLILASVLNILLNLFMVVVLKMGVAGVGLATVLAQLLSSILCFGVIRKKYTILKFTKEQMQFKGKTAGALLQMGIPMALQFSICSIGAMMVQSAMNALGSVAVAGYAVAGKLGSFMEQPFVSIGTAMATYIGQNFGAREYKRVHQGVFAGLVLSAVCSVILAVLSLTVIGPASAVFVGGAEVEVIELSKQYFRLIAWFYPFLGIIFVYRNSLQGIGDGLVPMLASVVEMIVRGGIILAVGIKYGFIGAAIANPLAWVAACFPLVPVFYYRMKRNRDCH